LDFLVDAAAGTCRCAFEKHVLENMRHACAKPFAFVNTACHAPRLRGHNRRAMILADDDRHPVVECGDCDAGRDSRDRRTITVSMRRQVLGKSLKKLNVKIGKIANCWTERRARPNYTRVAFGSGAVAGGNLLEGRNGLRKAS